MAGIGDGIEVKLEGPLFDGRGGPIFAAWLHGAMEVSVAQVEAETVRRTPVNTGILRASVGTKVVTHGSIGNGLPELLLGQIGSPIAYAPYVEYGTKPHWPPRAPIEAFVRRKMVSAVEEEAAKQSGRRRRSKKTARFASDIGPADSRERAIKAIAFLVARKIARKGTKPVKMFDSAMKNQKVWVGRTFMSAVNRAIKEINGT